MSGFLNLQDFPAAARLAADLIKYACDLRHEALHLFSDGAFSEWPEDINGGGWVVSGVKWQGQLLQRAPIASNIVRRHDHAILNAGYSMMQPGTEILPHVGYSNRVVRLHVGLLVPQSGDCALVVDGERRSWQPGEAMLFDDTVLHSAHNRSHEARIVFLADLVR